MKDKTGNDREKDFAWKEKSSIQQISSNISTDSDNLSCIVPLHEPQAIKLLCHQRVWSSHLQPTSATSPTLLRKFSRLCRQVPPSHTADLQLNRFYENSTTRSDLNHKKVNLSTSLSSNPQMHPPTAFHYNSKQSPNRLPSDSKT